MQLIPAIDLRNGRVVRLQQGDYQRETQYQANPLEQARIYQDAGAGSLHLVDLDAALNGGDGNLALIGDICRSLNAPVQTGGGVRSEADLVARFDVGAARIIIGSLCVRSPEQVCEWIGRHGSERIVAGLDVRVNAQGQWIPQAAGWTESGDQDLFTLLDQLVGAGLKHLLCTDIDCDGMLAGPSIGLYTRLTQRYPELSVQASGGIGSEADLERVAQTGVAGCIVGRALLEGQVPLRVIRQYQA